MFNFRRYFDKVAVITEKGKKFSYAELNGFCADLAEHLMPRSLVFNLSANKFGSLIGYVAALQYKNVPLMLDENIDLELLTHFIDLYKPDYLYVPSDKETLFKHKKVYEGHGYILLKTSFEHAYPLYDNLALLLTTSGSMGSPKFVRQSYENLETNTRSIIEYLEISDKERAITSLPMNYTYGLSIINSHLECGASLILTEATLMQKEFWNQIGEFQATSLSGVPYTYEMLDRLRFQRRDLPSLHLLTQAGGKLSPELQQKFAQYATNNGKKFVVMYGQTEATARMGWLPPEKAVEKFGAMGLPIPGGKFSLIDTDGREITTPETVGELVYEGKNVTLGYAENGDDLSKGDEFCGRLVTGDMAKFDTEGFYYIVGRKKRFLKIFGIRVNLDETERLIKSHFADLDCACCGKDDAMQIFINDESSLRAVKDFVAQTSKLNFSAFKVRYLSHLPKNEAGKTLYRELSNF